MIADVEAVVIGLNGVYRGVKHQSEEGCKRVLCCPVYSLLRSFFHPHLHASVRLLLNEASSFFLIILVHNFALCR